MVLSLNKFLIRDNIGYSSLKRGIFLLIMFIYGFFSTPTPDKLGVAEILIMFLLIALFFDNFVNIFKEILVAPFKNHTILITIIFLYFFILSTLWGLLWNQNMLFDFIRDFIPFLYFCLPIFIYFDIRKDPEKWLFTILLGMLIAGTGFIFQFYCDPSISLTQIGFNQLYGSNRDNPWQDPVSVFAFAFWAGIAMYSFLKRNFFQFAFYLFLYLIFFLVYASTVSRSPIILSFFVILIGCWFVRPIRTRNKWKNRVIFIILITPILYFLIYSPPDIIKAGIELIIQKTQRVGVTNARIIEMKAVINNISNASKLLFGEGWGGLIANPIGGGAKWRFVHNMFFYFVFKTGLIGLCLMLVYLMWILRVIRRTKFIIKYFSDFYAISFVALFPPMIVAGILEPMFKTLSFGILLSSFLAYYYTYLIYRYGRNTKPKKI